MFFIQGVVSEKPGIQDVKVSLEAKEAKISYSDGDITADKIAEYIEDMGFSAFVKEVNGQVRVQTEPGILIKNDVTRRELVLRNGGGDVIKEPEPSKCFLHIKVKKVTSGIPRSW